MGAQVVTKWISTLLPVAIQPTRFSCSFQKRKVLASKRWGSLLSSLQVRCASLTPSLLGSWVFLRKSPFKEASLYSPEIWHLLPEKWGPSSSPDFPWSRLVRLGDCGHGRSVSPRRVLRIRSAREHRSPYAGASSRRPFSRREENTAGKIVRLSFFFCWQGSPFTWKQPPTRNSATTHTISWSRCAVLWPSSGTGGQDHKA